MGENATGKGLTAKQRAALATLVVGRSVEDAAAAAGVNRSTVYRWQADPGFSAALRELDGAALRTLGRRVMALSEKAAQALEDALDPAQPVGVRLRAAAIVAERGPALAELTSIVERLEALEARLPDESKN